MAKSVKKSNSPRFGSFLNNSPIANARVPIDENNGTIPVDISGDPGKTYIVNIYEFIPGTGVGVVVGGPTTLTEDPNRPGHYTGNVSVGNVGANPPPNTNNRVIEIVDEVSGDIIGYAFAAVHAPSRMKTAVAIRCPNCDPKRPVPVALILKLDSAVAAGTCKQCSKLNQPTRLVHSNDAKYPCSWFSQPIKFCSGTDPAGVWMLQKSDASTWTLTLRRGAATVVVYSTKTKTKKDCSFPLKLNRVGKGGTECVKWPATVTIVPAP